MILSTAQKPSASLELHSQQLAADIHCRWVPRHRFSLARLMQEYSETDLMILTEAQLVYYQQDAQPLFFHPGTSMVRVKRMKKGETDPLVQAAQAELGDVVLDCTAGLASDSIVLSCAVGASGSVTSLESEPAIYLLIREGLKNYETTLSLLNAAMRRIKVELTNHLDVLKSMKDHSVDIVYFDPMFRKPLLESSSIAPLRSVANSEPLLAESVEEACRVARKTVVMKENRLNTEFQRLGFTKVGHRTSNIAYGVIHL